MKKTSPLMLPIIINKLKKRIDKTSSPLLKQYDLSKLHLLYMIALYERENGMTLKELSDYLDFDKANTSRAISQLILKGYVQKQNQGDLEFKYKAILTKKGREIACAISDKNQMANSELLKLLTKEELVCIAGIAHKLWGFLEKE